MIRLKQSRLIVLGLAAALALPLVTADAPPLPTTPPGVADGETAILTPQGTWIVPPPGAPLAIRLETDEITTVVNGSSWGIEAISAQTPAGPAALALDSCTGYRAGWYETNNYNLYGGHAGIRPQNLPVDTSNYCAGTGMGYTAGMSFGGPNWIQAGIVTFPAETTSKWMCQANNNGQLTTNYGLPNSYGNGATIYTWFARDSLGIWRTYRYDTGPFSIDLGCTIVRGSTNGEPLQVFGEIQGAINTNAPMGPWTMFDLRYQATSGTWYAPSQLQAHYKSGTPCPPYGAGVVSGGAFVAGSGQTCSMGTSPYPN